jgi:hypothetical protein
MTALSRFNILAIFIRMRCVEDSACLPWLLGGRIGGSGPCIVLSAGEGGAGVEVKLPELDTPGLTLADGVGVSESV